MSLLPPSKRNARVSQRRPPPPYRVSVSGPQYQALAETFAWLGARPAPHSR